MNIQLLGLGRSKSAASLGKLVPMDRLNKRFRNGKYSKKRPDPDGIIVNYGVRGADLRMFYKRFPEATVIPTINRTMPYNKMEAAMLAMDNAVPTPDVMGTLSSIASEPWIYKPYYSRAGHGIVRVTEENFHSLDWARGYAQREIVDRPYEVRVTGFLWMPQDEWPVWKKKKEGDLRNELTWNHEQGGTFVTVNRPTEFRVFREAMEHTATLLGTFNLAFGAADFILDSAKNLYFLEVNTRPGFTQGYSDGTYITAFQKLKEMARTDPESVITLCQEN